jgi:hypothetical protein
MRIEDIDCLLDGHYLCLFGGKNGHGKTSALTAVGMALCGRSGCDWPEVALKDGEDEGWVKVDIEPSVSDDATDGKLSDGFNVELYLKRRRDGAVVEQIRVTDKDGEELPSPRKLLQRLFELRGFDPLAFERMAPKEQKALIEKVTGVDLSGLREEYERLYKQRALVNRDAKNMRARYEAMPKHPGVPEQPVSANSLLEELNRRQEVLKTNASHREVLHKYINDCGALRTTKTETDQQIAAFEEQLANARKQRDFLEREIDETLANAENQKQFVDALVDPSLDEVHQQIKDADSINAKVRDNLAKSALFGDLHAIETEADKLNETLEANKKKQEDVLTSATWPLPGLSLDSEGVLFNGLPFSQASKSARIATSAKIGMALNPRLRLMVCQDGNDLDNESLDSLEKLLRDSDYQMILELVTRNDDDEKRCAVIIENGKNKEKNPESAIDTNGEKE